MYEYSLDVLILDVGFDRIVLILSKVLFSIFTVNSYLAPTLNKLTIIIIIFIWVVYILFEAFLHELTLKHKNIKRKY